MKLLIATTAIVSVLAAFGNSLESADTLVFCNPDDTVFWRTATNNVFAVQMPQAQGGQSVTVTGPRNFSANYVTDGSELAIETPLPSKPASEGLYGLSMDDRVEASVAVVKGGVASGSAEIVCRSGKSQWRTRRGEEVLVPIPAGATSFSIDGVEIETGLNGAEGWCSWKPASDGPWTFEVTVGETVCQATVEAIKGLVILFR